MKKQVFAVFISVLLAGCSTTIHVRTDEPLDNDRVFNYDQVNARMDGVEGSIVFRDGRVYSTIGAFVTPDTAMSPIPVDSASTGDGGNRN